MAMTTGELDEYETENCLLCNLRDTAIGYKELIGGSKAFDKVIKVIEDVMDKELMKEFDGNNPLLDYDPFISDPHRSRISHQ